MAELADARDSKSRGKPCRFESGQRHSFLAPALSGAFFLPFASTPVMVKFYHSISSPYPELSDKIIYEYMIQFYFTLLYGLFSDINLICVKIMYDLLGNRRNFLIMWFWLSLIALLCWSGSDLFSKIGCRDSSDKYSHLKMVIAVGTVMGLHAAFEIFVGGTEINWSVIWTYMPVSLLYIGSMTLGYLGLRYIELSVSSPICNSSGALVAVLTLLIIGPEGYTPLAFFAIGLVCVGAVGLGVVDAVEDPELRAERQAAGNYKYAKSFLALALPVAYCLLDAVGTFADNRVLETLNEDSANCAYELTFLCAAIFCFIYVVLIKKDKLVPKMEGPKYLGAICETAGQFAYIYAISDTAHLAMSAPIIASYCAASVLWSRIFLKEKLSWKHYAMICVIVAGIAVMGFLDL